MALFEGSLGEPTIDDDPATRSEQRRRGLGWVLVLVAIAIIGVFAFAPSPYVIEQPGPVYDTLGTTTTSEGDEVPLISIPDEETFETEGSLDLLTVSIVGSPERRPTWADVALAWVDSSKAVIPIEQVFPSNVTREERDAQNQAAMLDSQLDAIAAALVELDYDVERDVVVQSIAEGSPAEGVFEQGDVVTAVNGEPTLDVGQLRAAVQLSEGAAVDVTVLRGDATTDVSVEPVQSSGGAWVLGVGVAMDYEFPIDVEIQLNNVGGPSAGMMFALGIIDTLTPGPLTGGEAIAGTGTIDSSGVVGGIGGIRQKMYGARDAGASWMLAPPSNCSEVVGRVPDGLRVIPVETLEEARGVVERIGEGAGGAEFAECTAG